MWESGGGWGGRCWVNKIIGNKITGNKIIGNKIIGKIYTGFYYNGETRKIQRNPKEDQTPREIVQIQINERSGGSYPLGGVAGNNPNLPGIRSRGGGIPGDPSGDEIQGPVESSFAVHVLPGGGNRINPPKYPKPPPSEPNSPRIRINRRRLEGFGDPGARARLSGTLKSSSKKELN